MSSIVCISSFLLFVFFFFFNDTATTEIYTLSLHDALPILLDVLELFGGERTLLVQDRFARPDLADVVQPARDPHVLDVLLWDSELMGKGGGQVGDAGRMPPHIGVFGFQGVHEGLERGDRKA